MMAAQTAGAGAAMSMVPSSFMAPRRAWVVIVSV
jgi:hypothetical protein